MVDRCLPVLSVLLLCLLVMYAGLYYMAPRWLNESVHRLAEQRRESILWQQHVRLLQRHVGNDRALSAANSTLDDLQLGLQEQLDALAAMRQVSVIRADLEILGFDADIEPLAAHFTTVRLHLGLQIPHGGVLLQALSQLHESQEGRPAEWLGCSIERGATESHLDADCVLDVYHDDALSGMES